jgi:integrase-like protein
VDSVKRGRARTVPLVEDIVPLVDRWAVGKQPEAWLFAAPGGGPLRESNWKRSVKWSEATAAIGVPRLRVHDLRHTAASVGRGSGADPKVVQRVLGHATASMTMDLYGHLIDGNLWEAARRLGAHQGVVSELHMGRNGPLSPELGFRVEPPVGIEPTTFSLRARFPRRERASGPAFEHGRVSIADGQGGPPGSPWGHIGGMPRCKLSSLGSGCVGYWHVQHCAFSSRGIRLQHSRWRLWQRTA